MYKFNLSKDMKIHSMFHVSLLLLLKHDLMRQQMSESSFVIVENKKNSYFIDSIDNISVMNIMSSWHLVSSDYSSCASQIYISVCSFIALRKSSSSHSYFEFSCHYRVSESSYAYKHTERCIETFLYYFHNNLLLQNYQNYLM